MEYDLEIEKVIKKIKSEKINKVCIQLPDGLKTRAKEIKEKIEKETEAKTFIWLGTCFGACDMPEQLNKIGIELLIQWGHSEF